MLTFKALHLLQPSSHQRHLDFYRCFSLPPCRLCVCVLNAGGVNQRWRLQQLRHMNPDGSVWVPHFVLPDLLEVIYWLFVKWGLQSASAGSSPLTAAVCLSSAGVIRCSISLMTSAYLKLFQRYWTHTHTHIKTATSWFITHNKTRWPRNFVWSFKCTKKEEEEQTEEARTQFSHREEAPFEAP